MQDQTAELGLIDVEGNGVTTLLLVEQLEIGADVEGHKAVLLAILAPSDPGHHKHGFVRLGAGDASRQFLAVHDDQGLILTTPLEADPFLHVSAAQ